MSCNLAQRGGLFPELEITLCLCWRGGREGQEGEQVQGGA